MQEPLIFSLDFDGTFTSDPELWTTWIALAQKRGHTVVCITARTETPDNVKELRSALPKGIRIVFAGYKAKMNAAEALGLIVGVWIDDWPSLIINETRRYDETD